MEDRHLLPVDSIKLMGEAVGVANLNDDAAVKASEELEYRLKEIIQDAVKFMRHGKRRKLVSTDIDSSLKVKNVEPLYGFEGEYIPFRHTSGGGKDLFYSDEQEVGLVDLVNSQLPRLPCDVTIRAHWLSVEGVQPVIPENPPPLSASEEATASNFPETNVSQLKKINFEHKDKKKVEEMGTEWSKLKPLQGHALSNEQQLYYKEITAACIGIGSDAKWQEALNSLGMDPGIYQLLPQFTNFIIEGIRVNMGQRKLVVLKHLVKMVGALLENTSLSLEKYLHELIPSLVSCLISRQLCMRPESEDHWSLRDNIAKILAKICSKYSNPVNNIQSRIQRVLLQTIKTNHSLATHYGALSCLIEMGQDTVVSLVVPQLKQEGVLIRTTMSQQGKSTEHAAANKLQSLLLRHCAVALLATRPASDTVVQYQNDYGSLGQPLFNQVKTLRQNRVGMQSVVTARVSNVVVAKPPATATAVSLVKSKPPPLSLSSQVLALRANSGSKLQSPVTAVSTPTLAAALQLVTQAAKSNPATPTASTPSMSAASLLSAVMNSPGAHALTEQLTAALGNTGGSNGTTDKSPKSSSAPST